MNHYFTDNRHLKENRKELSFRFWCFTCTFVTDNGVFSKDAVDYGTRALLNTVHEHGQMGNSVLDIGCGYGVIGIVLKKEFPHADVTMADVNPRALQLAKENAVRNQVSVNVLESDGYGRLEGSMFTDIVTNPPIRAGKAVIYKMFEEAYDHLEEGGAFWVVIRKAQGALSAKAKIESVFGNCEIVHRDKGYFVLKSVKRN